MKNLLDKTRLVRRIVAFVILLGLFGIQLPNAHAQPLITATGDLAPIFPGGITSWDLTGTSLSIANGADGTLTIEGGASVQNDVGFIAFNPGTTGISTVKSGSNWTNSAELYVGLFGTGTLNVESGATVDSGTDLFVGMFGTGTMKVDSGGTVNSARGIVGTNAGSMGTATVTGAGSHWNNSTELNVGVLGNGTLNIEAGGMVTSTNAFVGKDPAGVGLVKVSGAGTIWNNSGNVSIGDDIGLGNPGEATSGKIEISSGTVTVDGMMKLYEPGTVDLSGGKLVVGTLDLSPETSGGIEVNTTENFNMTGGQLVVDQIEGSFKQNGGTLTPGGTFGDTFAPGEDSFGQTAIRFDLEMLAGAIEFEIGSLADFDTIDVGGGDPGIADLDGTMDINLIGFTPEDGDSFQLIFTSGGGIVWRFRFRFYRCIWKFGVEYNGLCQYRHHFIHRCSS